METVESNVSFGIFATINKWAMPSNFTLGCLALLNGILLVVGCLAPQNSILGHNQGYVLAVGMGASVFTAIYTLSYNLVDYANREIEHNTCKVVKLGRKEKRVSNGAIYVAILIGILTVWTGAFFIALKIYNIT